MAAGLLLGLYEIFTVLPALLLHPPKFSEKPIAELIDAGGYTTLGGIDVRVPLDVLRNLSMCVLGILVLILDSSWMGTILEDCSYQ